MLLAVAADHVLGGPGGGGGGATCRLNADSVMYFGFVANCTSNSSILARKEVISSSFSVRLAIARVAIISASTSASLVSSLLSASLERKRE